MKILCDLKLLVICKNIKDGKDGKRYYNLAIISTDGEAGNVRCTEEVYENVNDTMKEYKFRAEYNDKYDSFRLVTMSFDTPVPVPVPSAPPAKPATSSVKPATSH